MDRDDAQHLRHGYRLTAEQIAIFYEELLRAKLPEAVAARITIDHYRWLMTPNQADEMMRMAVMFQEMMKGEADDEGA